MSKSTTSHLYTYVPTWMTLVKTCRKSPPPLFHVYSILYSCRSCACLVAALTCLPAPPVDLAALSVLSRHTLSGQWNRQREVDCTRQRGCKAREKEMEFFFNFNQHDHVGSWRWRGGFCISSQAQE